MINHSMAGPKLGDPPAVPTHFLDVTIGQWRSIETGKLSKPKCLNHASDNCRPVCAALLEGK